MVDTGLIKRCQQGEGEAFDELYQTYATKALRTAYLLVGNKNIAEDIMQEAFFECYRDIKKLRTPELFQVWFNRLLVRISWRMASRERKVIYESLNANDMERLPDRQDVLEVVEANQESQVIRQAINKLSIPLRTTMILYYYNDMSVKEISQIMNCFQGTVKSRLLNGRKKLARELKSKPGNLSIRMMPGCLKKESVTHE
ncbi:RNA polymerase sigma factor, sigma-70 family [Desulfoscipio gibsoniae DSM 7213]|uniref:RNA polymerase sigma factor, sigma-70 family n=1 Tax=Desulfoscipio gibsoniae DSM 7213 TaxID=767817 RepID=R4KLQ2_9FIRM|nr:RNA polymerase sigma factor, sigma-70 family [Desulfoscipio gibsoniae DSM 7213]